MELVKNQKTARRGLDLSLECAVENAAELSVEEFNRKYFLPQKPVLLKGLANLQPAGEKWTISWFKETMGDLEIPVFDSSVKERLYSTIVEADFKMPFGEFLDLIARDEPCSIRIFRYNLFKENPALREDFQCPKFINQGLLKNMAFMFLGGKDTEVRLHYDVDMSNVLLTQIYGRKRVLLFPNDQGVYLYKLPYNTHSPVDLNNPDFDKYPALKYAKGYEIIQEPGDGLFMPSGYWHYNTYLEGGISIAYRKMAHTFPGVWQGLSFVAGTMPYDKVMNFALGDKWLKRKKKLSFELAEQAIQRSINLT